MATTLVTGGTGFIGSHVVKQLADRGDALRLLIRKGRDASHLDGIEFERADGDVTDRDSVRAAMEGVERVFHVAGKTSMRTSDRERVFEVNVGGTRNVMEEALRAGVIRAVHTSSAGAVGPAEPEGTADESQPFMAGRLGIAYINAKHDAEGVAMRVAAKGLPVVVVNPTFVLGPDDPSGTSNRLVRRLLLRRIPAYIEGGLNIVDVRDVARGHLLADEVGHEGERYLLAARNFTLQRLFADLSRIAGVPPPPLKLHGPALLASVEALDQRRPAGPGVTGRGPLRDAVVDLSQRQGRPRARLRAAPPRGDAGGDGRLAARAARAARSGPCPLRHRPARSGRGLQAASIRLMEAAPPEPRRVLYRCRTPTNFLCPCGAVARALSRAGLEYRTERVPFGRDKRPEIVELTGQNRVPVLVDGEEVVHDSRRIREYLDWRYPSDPIPKRATQDQSN